MTTAENEEQLVQDLNKLSPSSDEAEPISPTSRSVDILNSVEVAEITEMEGELGVASALRYCKTRVLVPYLRLLAAVGLRPLALEACGQWIFLTNIISYIYLALVLGILILGYILQFMACFRRDRGPSIKPDGVHNIGESKSGEIQCPGSFLFSFILPSVLHLATYLYALHLFRIQDNEQLQNLMERVFVVSCTPGEGNSRPKRLARSLWILIAMAALWLILATLTSILAIIYNPPIFRWLEHSNKSVVISLRILLGVGTLAQDIFQATLVSGYCLQAQLLAALAVALKHRLLQHTLAPIDWMREMREFGELLRHLNKDLAPAICILGLVSTSWALSAASWLLGWAGVSQTTPAPGLSLLPVTLWALLAIAPFLQAARLSNCCHGLRGVGHEVRARPFVYQDTPSQELDSLLLFSSSLRLRAWLCGTPVSGRGLILAFVILVLVALTLGQIQRLPLPWPQI